MTDKIVWHNFRNNEPPRLNDYYIIEDTGGTIYIDKWIHKPFENYYGHIVETKWRGTHNGYVERWAEVDGISLREFVELVNREG